MAKETKAEKEEREAQERRYVSTEQLLAAQRAGGGVWPPQETEYQLEAARLEGRLTEDGEKQLKDLHDGDLDEGTGDEARELLQGAVDKVEGNADSEQAKALDDKKSEVDAPSAKEAKAKAAKDKKEDAKSDDTE